MKKKTKEVFQPKKRVQLTFTLKDEVRYKFNYLCVANFINKSQLLESFIEQYINEHPIEYPPFLENDQD